MTSNHVDVLVVGAGAAGLIAAQRAAEMGARVVVLEKNERPGLKLLISGGGKCNLTHAGSIAEIRAAFRPTESRFLKAAFYRFFNADLVRVLNNAGIPTYSRPDGRVFPVEPRTARDVVAALEHGVAAAGAEIVTRVCVAGLSIEDGRVVGVRHDGAETRAESVVVAVGGSSYPATGTTGDGWKWAAAAGHKIVPLRAALAPIYLERAEPEWSGVALADVALRARVADSGREYARRDGDLLFTHKGISGPCVLDISREIAERMAGTGSAGIVEVDLAPAVDFEQVRETVRRELAETSNRPISSVLERFVPHRLSAALASAADVDPALRGHSLTAKALNRLVSTVKGWSLGPVRAIPLERGEVVAGGVSLDEVDAQTMRSKVVEGLYLCGEILDVAGPVGGYNLQAAWSTGYVAGESAAKAAITT
jgi:hypothetical protein